MSPRHERSAGDDTADLELKAVSVPSPEEGHVTVAVLKPRTLPRLVALFAAAVILVALTAYSSTWLAYQQANRNTREQIAALNEDLAARRAQRAATDQRNAAAAETLRRYACALARAAPNPDPDIEQMRTDLACDATPAPDPSTSPGAPAAPGPSTSSIPAGRGGGVSPPGRAPTGGRSPIVGMPRPAPPPPRPTTARPPSSGPGPSPTDDPLIGCAHLPLLGKVCV